MLNEFWNGIGKALTSEWVKQAFAPAFVFWGGGLLALVWRDGWGPWMSRWVNLSLPAQITVLAIGLIGVAVSAAVMQRLEYPMLRLLEGYWPNWPGIRWLRKKLTDRQNRKLDEAKDESIRWLSQGLDTLSAADEDAFVKADLRVRNAPLKRGQRMPTGLGNVLRAAERRPRDRYGLESIYVWPRLWLLMPEQTREDVGAARGGLNLAVRVFTWGAFFVLWGVVAWWAAIVGILVAVYAYNWTLIQARTYGDLFEAAFDLHRFLLYDALGWPRPKSSIHEKLDGERLSKYLHRGFTGGPVFYRPSEQ